MEEGIVRFHYVKNAESQLVVGSNKYVADTSLLTLHGENIEDSDKQDIVSNTSFEAIIPSIKNYFFISA